MEQVFNALQSHLEAEKALFSEMLSLAEEQREALVQRNTEALSDLASRHTRLLLRLQRQEQEGKELVGNVAASVGLVGKTATLSEIAERLEPTKSVSLLAQREQIFRMTERLGQVNRINAELFQTAMQSIQFLLQLMAGTPAAPRYPAHPNFASGPVASLMVDQRA